MSESEMIEVARQLREKKVRYKALEKRKRYQEVMNKVGSESVPPIGKIISNSAEKGTTGDFEGQRGVDRRHGLSLR